MLNRAKTRAVALLAATFVAGIVIGAGVRTMWAGHAAASANRAHGPDRMLASLAAELHFTPL